MAKDAVLLKLIADSQRLLSRRLLVFGVGILVWVGIAVGIAVLVEALTEDVPQWADALIYFGWVILIGLHLFLELFLDAVAERIARRRLSAAEPYYQNADTFREQGQYDLAVKEYGIVFSIDPDNARAYTGRGNIYELKGEHVLAVADFTSAIEMDPFIRGLAHIKSMGKDAGDYDLAWAYYYRGCSYISKGDIELAKSDFESAISVGNAGFPTVLAENELRTVQETQDVPGG